MATQAEKLPVAQATGHLEPVAYFDGPMPTGVTVSHRGRIFVNFPKWGDDVTFTVAEIRSGLAVPFPDLAANGLDPDDQSAILSSVQSVVVDPLDRLWILDTGRPLFQPLENGDAKLVCVDLAKNRIVKIVLFPANVALRTTYLNDIRFHLGLAEEGLAFITDSSEDGPNGIIVVDLATGESWRKLHDHPSTMAEDESTFLPVVEGRPCAGMTMGADGLALSPDGERLFYSPLCCRRLYSVSTRALADRNASDAEAGRTVVDEGDKGGAGDGLESNASGDLYATNFEHNAILRRRPTGEWDTVAHDPRLLWPDTLSLALDGHLYVTANQLHRQARFQNGRDQRETPYTLFRIFTGEQPVLLR